MSEKQETEQETRDREEKEDLAINEERIKHLLRKYSERASTEILINAFDYFRDNQCGSIWECVDLACKDKEERIRKFEKEHEFFK